MKYYIETWGCQMNDHDSEVIAGFLEKSGYVPAAVEPEADLIILNTCCVREKAENKVFGKLGELKKLKAQNPGLLIGVCGCMVQQPQMAQEISQKAPQVDLIFGTHNLHRLPELLAELETARDPLVEVWSRAGEVVEDLPVKRTSAVRGNVNITYGCNNFCAYCIVPYVRGRERSREPSEILKEVRDLAGRGITEVMLLGQNVNSYGKGLNPPADFAGLLQEVDRIPGIRRIRYMTSHPRDFSDKLLQTIKNSAHVCRHFHLPVQAGSDKILKAMRRGYTREQYLELVHKIRQEFPGAAVTTDLIVGFPGETSADFAETMSLVQEAQFDAAYTFIYSPRRGTPAAKMADPVPLEEKKANFQRLLELVNALSLKSNQRLVGTVEEILVEGVGKANPAMVVGHTGTNKTVVFPGDESLTGTYAKVRVEEAKTWSLKGVMVDNE